LKKERKPRKRYLVFKLYTIGGSPDFETFRSFLDDYMRRFLGLSGLIDSRVKLIRYDQETRYGIIRIISTDIDTVLLAFTRIRDIKDTPASFIPLRLTGNLSRALKYIKRYEKRIQ
jgi:RNase P/RNase MRP subunit POP5